MSANLLAAASQQVLAPPPFDRPRCERLRRIRQTLAPAEAAARAEADQALAELKRAKHAETRSQRLGLSMLSPEIFSWKKGRLPAFAVFALQGDGKCTLSSNPAKTKVPACCRRFYAHGLPEPAIQRVERFVSGHFKVLWCVAALLVEAFCFYRLQPLGTTTLGRFLLGQGLGILASFCVGLMGLVLLIGAWTLLMRGKATTATARLAGVIPEPVRARIKRYEREFREVLIVTEAQWSFRERRKGLQVPASCDPLVVGWDGDYFWLIAQFDTSPLEQLVADEYAVQPEGSECPGQPGHRRG